MLLSVAVSCCRLINLGRVVSQQARTRALTSLMNYSHRPGAQGDSQTAKLTVCGTVSGRNSVRGGLSSVIVPSQCSAE